MATRKQRPVSKYKGKQGNFTESLEEFAGYAMEMATQIFRSVVIEVGSSVIRLSPVLTGQFKGNWALTIDTAYTQKTAPVDKEGQDTINEIVRRAQSLNYGQTAYIVNNLPYAVPLEYGYSKKAPAGMVRITQARFQEIVQQAIREVGDQ